ncbi:MAG TPA: GAF domain-containing protein [Acidimicrobiales bacterium]|nr:GAF domain-containing protein [Acidimicrobiales bacterium]
MTTKPESIPLASIQPAFEGLIPATIASCSAEGIPNVSYLSIVRRIDSERIAVTNQFFSKTSRNVRHNPYVVIRVVNPNDLAQYDLEARYLHSESSGELFEDVRVQLDAIAAQTGMAGTFRLRSVDILHVDRCALVGAGQAGRSGPQDRDPMSILAVFVRRLATSRDLAEATRVGLELLDDLFGFEHSILLLADEAAQRLFVIASHGYTNSRVGGEIAVGDGLIGVVAERRHIVRVGSMVRSRTFAAAVTQVDPYEPPVRGLDEAQSMIALPMMVHDRLVGVLYLDSAQAGTFDAETAQILEVIAGHLAVTLGLLKDDGADPPEEEPHSPVTPPVLSHDASLAPRLVAFHESDGSVFVDGAYIIRGVPGRILARLLGEHQATARTQFSNKELRLDRTIELPPGNDNLEARLLVLRKRLAEKSDFIVMERVGRGRNELTVNGPFELQRHLVGT